MWSIEVSTILTIKHEICTHAFWCMCIKCQHNNIKMKLSLNTEGNNILPRLIVVLFFRLRSVPIHQSAQTHILQSIVHL